MLNAIVRRRAVLLFLVALSFATVTAGAGIVERRIHYRFLPNPAPPRDDPRIIRATAIVSEGEYKLILDFGRTSWILYDVQSDRVSCRTHERIQLAGSIPSPSVLTIDSPLEGCTSKATLPDNVTRVHAGSRGFSVDSQEWKAHGAPGARGELGPDLARLINGQVASLARINPYVRIFCDRVAPLYGTVCSGPPENLYIVNKLPIDCGFDARHDEPCPADPTR